MPINYDKYPPDWKETVERIKKRAHDKCEFCGIENKAVGYRMGGKFLYDKAYQNAKIRGAGSYFWGEETGNIRIVLTVAHLDHDETNHDVKDERLKALCQQCHLRYDAPEKAKRRREKKEKADRQLKMTL